MNQSKCPRRFRTLEFEYSFSKKPERVKKIWDSLQLRETFTRGQLFPYRVEFDAESQRGPFQPGELNNHHGPFLSLHGAIGEVSDSYRDLQYFYGAYVISFRLVRPVRLEFFREQNQIKVKFTSYVRPWFKPLWHGFNWFFWRAFALTIIV